MFTINYRDKKQSMKLSTQPKTSLSKWYKISSQIPNHSCLRYQSSKKLFHFGYNDRTRFKTCILLLSNSRKYEKSYYCFILLFCGLRMSEIYMLILEKKRPFQKPKTSEPDVWIETNRYCWILFMSFSAIFSLPAQ